MCGIAGAWLPGERHAADVARAMTDALVHRGPDDCGYWAQPEAGLAMGHRRLSILDTTRAGRQPMASTAQRLHVVYNGEIYNFRELRTELEHAGHRFETRSDTEVLLAAWERWGADSLQRLRGMFAFALWDDVRRELVLVRDRLGIKPLYYAERGGGILFASELRSLLASGQVARTVDRQAIWDYLSHGAISEPRTLLSEVRALPAGHMLRLRAGRMHVERYWDVVEATTAARAAGPPSYEEAVAETRRLLEQSMAYHLISDVPLGAFLSGGIDSTAVVALANRVAGRPIRTFAVGFGGEHAALDELRWARLVAERFDCVHTEVVLTAADVGGLLDRAASALDQPSVDGANTFVVSEAARRDVTVALSGLGGDELFAGYPHFLGYARGARLAPAGAAALPSGAVARVTARLPGRWRGTIEMLAATPAERIAGFRLLAHEAEKRVMVSRRFMDGFVPEPPAARAAALLRPELEPIAQVSYAEVNGYLRNTLLRDADSMSMAHSLEIRPVLLDHELVEYAFALPGAYKVADGKAKRVLVDALGELLPPEVVTRRKMGFELPFGDWLRGPLRARAGELLESPAARCLFSGPWRGRLSDELDGRGLRPHRLWSVMMLLAYLEDRQLCLPS